VADSKAQYVVKVNSRNLSGASTTFQVLSGVDDDGKPVFTDTQQVGPGRQVLAIDSAGHGVVYRVNQGTPMVAAELQPGVGDLIRVTGSKAPTTAGTLWMVLDDETVVETTQAFERVTDERFAELLLRVPLPPPAPEPLPAEGDEVLDGELEV